MRTTVTLDDDLLETAKEYVDIDKTSDLLNHVLREFIAREATLRIAAMGGSDPDAEAPPRRRFW